MVFRPGKACSFIRTLNTNMNKKRESKLIKFLTIAANIMVIYGILYSRLTERFASTLMQLAGYGMIVCLLIVNTFLLLSRKTTI